MQSVEMGKLILNYSYNQGDHVVEKIDEYTCKSPESPTILSNVGLITIDKIGTPKRLEYNEDVTYSIIVSNNSIKDLNGIVVTDTLIDGLKYLSDAKVYINMVDKGSIIPSETGNTLKFIIENTLKPQDRAMIMFSVRNDSIDAGNIITNRAYAQHKNYSEVFYSNEDIVNHDFAEIELTKSAVDPSGNKIDKVNYSQEFYYCSKFTNIGNLPVIVKTDDFVDKIYGGFVLKTDNILNDNDFRKSILIGKSKNPSLASMIDSSIEATYSKLTASYSYITLGNFNIDGYSSIYIFTHGLVKNQTDYSSIVKNYATLDYIYNSTKYEKDFVTKNTESNIASVSVLASNISINLISNESFVRECSYYNYYIHIQNKETGPISNVRVYDKLDSSLDFVKNSVKIDGKKVKANIEEGIWFDKLNPEESHTISFSVKVKKSPYDSVIKNVSNIDYSIGDNTYTISSNTVDVSVFRYSCIYYKKKYQSLKINYNYNYICNLKYNVDYVVNDFYITTFNNTKFLNVFGYKHEKIKFNDLCSYKKIFINDKKPFFYKIECKSDLIDDVEIYACNVNYYLNTSSKLKVNYDLAIYIYE